MLQINISGNITADALTKTINGKSCISFTVANNISTVKQDGTITQQTSFLNCSLWNKPNAANLFYKGRPVAISGLLNIKTANDRIYLNVSVLSFQVFGKAKVQNEPAEIETRNDSITGEPFDSGFAENEKIETVDLPF